MKYVVRESFKTYQEITKPLFVDKIDHLKFNEWIYNILDGKKEKDLRVFENDQFYFNKDWAFNHFDINSLYCLAIPRQRDLQSVRDLTVEHLPLLRSIRDECLKAIKDQYGL